MSDVLIEHSQNGQYKVLEYYKTETYQNYMVSNMYVCTNIVLSNLSNEMQSKVKLKQYHLVH